MHTLFPRTWLLPCCRGLCPVVAMASVCCIPLPAADEKPLVVVKFVDAETKEPLVGARVVIPVVVSDPRYVSVTLPSDPLSEPAPLPLPPGVPQPPAREHRVVTDASGAASLPMPQPGIGIAVLHEKGVAWLDDITRTGDDAGIPVRLQAWSRIEGRVMKRGKPVAGVVISVARQMEHVIMGSTFSLYTPPLQHGTWMVTDEQGRFAFEHLLPTSVDGDYGVPYRVSQSVRTGDSPFLQRQPEPGAMDGLWGGGPATADKEGGLSLGMGTIALEPGQRGEVELEALPRCVRQVSGRLVLADGTPFVPQPDAQRGGERVWPGFSPRIPSVGMTIGLGGTDPIQSDGRFTVTLPLSGRWSMSLSDHVFGLEKSDFEFTLPEPVDGSEHGEAVDLGDIVVRSEARLADAGPISPAVDGQFVTGLRVTDESGNTLDGVTASIAHLESRSAKETRCHYPRGLPVPERGADGLLHFKVPATYLSPSDEPSDAGKVWAVTHAGVKLECPGYETDSATVAAGSKGMVVMMKRLATCKLRVTLDGKPLKHREAHLEVGWSPHRGDFGSAGWSEDKSSGVLTHSKVPPGQWQVQAGHLGEDGWRWFSEAREIDVNVESAEVVEIPLKRGALLEGQISNDVPRPIRQGMVRVLVIMPESTTGESSRIYWRDWQNLDEAGHFSFKGLPAGEAWLAASCDGWISTPWKPSGKSQFKPAGSMTWGGSSSMEWTSQLVTVSGDMHGHVIPMIRSGACVLKFSETDGTPVQGADFSWYPGLRSGGLISEDLASTDRALDHLLRGPSEGGYTTGAFLPRVWRKTSANGELYVGNIPPGKVRFSLGKDRGTFYPADEGPTAGRHPFHYSAPFQLEIKPGEAVRAEFTVKRVEW